MEQYRYFSLDLLTARKYRMLLSLSLNLRVMIDLLRLFSVLLIVLCMFLCVCVYVHQRDSDRTYVIDTAANIVKSLKQDTTTSVSRPHEWRPNCCICL